MDKTKVVTSLLFSSVMRKDIYETFALACDDVAAKEKYDHVVPQLDVKELDNAAVKCVFDFSGHLSNAEAYDAALESFFTSHERFICDVLSIADDAAFQLSALVSIDTDLEVFALKCPRIPQSISTFQNFEFEYWIWHLRDEGAAS